MSSYLWKAYYENDVLAFRQYLQAAAYSSKIHTARGGSTRPVVGSPEHVGPSSLNSKSRKLAARSTPGSGGKSLQLTRADVNVRDATGKTLLHHAASSTADTAFAFASALIEHPLVDLYLQDYENGWTALHRAFYFGSVTIARLILERDAADALGRSIGHVQQTLGLIKVKDKEGLGPLDLYAATIKDFTWKPQDAGRSRSDSGSSDEDLTIRESGDENGKVRIPFVNIECDQLYTFGSNKNVSLGFGDEDDRQFPERINLWRPEHLLRRFYIEHLEQNERKWHAHDASHAVKNVNVSEMWVEDIPWMPKSRQLIVQDVEMSKLHSAVITSDPESNLYVCGHGKGGRLGLGDEQTRFNFVCVEAGALAGKRVVTAALGLNHTLALSDEGEIFSWGNNGFGQLGYSLPRTTSKDEDPIATTPRQIFGPLKREVVIGVAASKLHSVAHTGSSLFTFGKNEGQLGIVDSDARSLDMQIIPRKVAASLFAANIVAVTAMDKATVCLLENHEVWVFANYGYAKVPFPLEGFTNHFLKQSFLVTTYDHKQNHVVKVTCGGDTICALSSRGEIYTLSITRNADTQASTSTTNPAKIRNAITQPLRIWSPKKNSMAARDVGVDADGSIILSTEEGSVWKRTKRVTIKDATASGIGDYKPKDYKFSRISGLTRVLAVRASAHGAYAALRQDCDITQTDIDVEDLTLLKDLSSLLSLKQPVVKLAVDDELDNETRLRFWQGHRKLSQLQMLKRAIIESRDLEADMADLEERSISDASAKYDALLCTTLSKVRIPVHRFVLTGRSRVMRRGFRDLCETSTFTISDLAISEIDKNGRTVVKFQGLDLLTILNLVIYLYTDSLIDLPYRYREIRTELMRVATKLELLKLEPAARQMVQPKRCLDIDFELAFQDPAFSYDGDVLIELEDDEVRVHSALVRARCPFFQGLFVGHAGGRWLAGREDDDVVTVDLKHVSSKTFNLVLRHIYTDIASELFQDIVSVGLDDFLDSIMDVLSVANELMLDRLSQICQEVIGRFVNARNVCGLLNAISPSSVHEFKNAALEYLCLSLEAMLQGHYLSELDEDILQELDEVVRGNQLACMRHARNGRAEALLHQHNPDLAAAIERNRQAQIDAISSRSKSLGLQGVNPGNDDVELLASPMQHKSRRKSLTMPKSELPLLKAKPSSRDMMFDMDQEVDSNTPSPAPSPSIRPMSKTKGQVQAASSFQEEVWYDSRGKELTSLELVAQSTTPGAVTTPKTPLSSSQPWRATTFTGAKTEMKDIMAQTASSRTSALTQGLASDKASISDAPTSISLPVPKMSQKDRKRLQQSQQLPPAAKQPQPTPETTPISKGPAWQSTSAQHTPKDVLNQPNPISSPKPGNTRATSTPQLTMRQTVANAKPPGEAAKPAIGPGGQNSVQQRSISDSKALVPDNSEQRRSSQPIQPSSSKPIPQSIRYQPPLEPVLGLSMSEIVAQQQLEKDVVKEAIAKRDLQDIQAEQEFEEWWSRESARVQEAEKGEAGTAKSSKRRRGRGGRGAKGDKGAVESRNPS